MKAVIFDGSRTDDDLSSEMQGHVEGALREMGYAVETLHFRSMKMARCTGCFGCWVKSPGECTIDDAGRLIPRGVIGTDLLVFHTPVTFGGYSSTLKVGLDRMIPILLPFFKDVGGEIHHPLRYDVKYPFVLGVGVLAEQDGEAEAIFARLVNRNGWNMQGRGSASLVLHRGDGKDAVKAIVSEKLKAGGMPA